MVTFVAKPEFFTPDDVIFDRRLKMFFGPGAFSVFRRLHTIVRWRVRRIPAEIPQFHFLLQMKVLTKKVTENPSKTDTVQLSKIAMLQAPFVFLSLHACVRARFP